MRQAADTDSVVIIGILPVRFHLAGECVPFMLATDPVHESGSQTMDHPPAQADLFVILGATGDLAQHMLFPSLYFLDADGLLPADVRILGAARAKLDRAGFLKQTKAAIVDRSKPAAVDKDVWERFAARVDYCAADASKPDGAAVLKAAMGKADLPVFYLALSPSLFEPLWNNLAIDHVQITVAETAGVGDRWPYYDEYGALRDMLQNHMLQLLCLVAMEPPSDLDPDSVRNEKVKVLRSLRPYTRAMATNFSVRGQYTAGVVEGAPVESYESERGQPSSTETFVALRADIDNWRWAGVPFFLRTGKRLPERRTQIVIQFKGVPHSIFGGAGDEDLIANRLIIDLQPDEDIQLLLMNKSPGVSGRGMRLQSLPLSLSLARTYAGSGSRRPIAYEPLLMEILNGVTTLFVRRDEVEQAWSWVDGVANAWTEASHGPKPYSAGSWGPAGAFALIERFGKVWHE